MKKEFFVERRLMEQKHEEETVRIESDILRIKAEMDTLERQLTGKYSILQKNATFALGLERETKINCQINLVPF